MKMKTTYLIAGLLIITAATWAAENNKPLTLDEQNLKNQELLLQASDRLMNRVETAEKSFQDVKTALENKQAEKLLVQKELVRLQRDNMRLRQKYVRQPELVKQVEELYAGRTAATRARLSIIRERLKILSSRMMEQELAAAESTLLNNPEAAVEAAERDSELQQIVQERYAAAQSLIKPAR